MPKKDENQDVELDSRFVYKNMKIQSVDVDDSDLKKINKLALSPLKADEVFVFKMNMADNELDDRNYEPFNLQALKDLKNLYIGKTVIKDHSRRSDNQVARIYDTELISSPDKVTGAGEVHTDLVSKVYMVKTQSNADLITEIKAGIKKEVSTGCMPKKAVCSICGKDNMKDMCPHLWGKEYETPQGKKTCFFTLDGAKEAYEVSFVAVPAQPRAGACKCYGGIKDGKEESFHKPLEQEEQKQNDETKKDLELELRIKQTESFLFAQNHKEDK